MKSKLVVLILFFFSCTPTGQITHDQLRDSLIISGGDNIKIFPGEITIARALQFQDSVNQVKIERLKAEIIEYQSNVDSLLLMLSERDEVLDSIFAPPIKENDYSDTVLIAP